MGSTFGVGGSIDPGGQYLGIGAAANHAQPAYMDPGQRPQLPGYQPLTNTDGSAYQGYSSTQLSNPQAFTPQMLADPRYGQTDGSGLAAQKALATGTGPTAWGSLQQQQNDQTTAAQRNSAEGTAASSAGMAQDQLAMSGGLTGGAAERTGLAGMQNRDQALQGVARDDASRKLTTSIADQGRRDTAASALPGEQLAAGQFDMQNAGIQNAANAANVGATNSAGQFNAGRQDTANQFNATAANNAGQFNANMDETEAQRRSSFDQSNYGSQAGIYGGISQGNATIAAAQAGKKSGSSFICTELRRQGLMTASESKFMLDFMLRSIRSRADFFLWYFKNGETLIRHCKERGEDWARVKRNSVDFIIALIHAGREVDAQNAYIQAVELLNISHGHVMGKMPKSIYGNGKIKHYIALPQVFMLKSTWRWLNEFMTAKVEKKISKLSRRIA